MKYFGMKILNKQLLIILQLSNGVDQQGNTSKPRTIKDSGGGGGGEDFIYENFIYEIVIWN